MAGCFGSTPEDRARQNELNKYLDAQDAQAAMIDKRADDIYRAKLESLPVAHHVSSTGRKILNFDDAIGEPFYGDTDDGIALACAVRDNNPEEAGRLLIKLITNKLRERAEEEAEDGL